MSGKVKSTLKKYWLFYLIGIIIILGLKYFYSKAGSGQLGWILTPTAWWVKTLSGIPFEKEFNIGFVNHSYRFIIAPSCAGINFMIITFATLLFSFLHRIGKRQGRLLWIPVCLIISYLFTVLVNGCRITISIYLLGLDIYGGWITHERIHMLEGTVIYVTSLLIIYIVINEILKRFEVFTPESSAAGVSESNRILRKLITPLFWYTFVTLGIPFLNRAYRNDGKQFMEHTIIIAAVCLAANVLFCLMFILKKRISLTQILIWRRPRRAWRRAP